MHLTGIILSGGESSRLGFDKSLVVYQGKTLIERAMDVFNGICDNILISTNKPGYDNFGALVIPDIEPGKGPMMGIYSCLLTSGTEHHLVLAVDNFHVGRDFYEYVRKNISHTKAALPFVQNLYWEPLTGYYNRNILQEMKAFIDKGNYKLPDLLDATSAKRLLVESDFPGWQTNYFQSLNRPEDLEFLRSIGK